MKNKIDIIELGIMDYVQVYNLQKELLQKRKQDQIPDTLIVVEHPHTITYGRLAKQQNILVSEKILKEKKIPVYKIDRGGDFTYHGPGQIVAYPIINLKNYNLDLKGYFEFLENIIIDFLKSYGIISCRGVKHRGVWVGCNKIAAMGIGVSRWVAYHGIAVNINTDLEYFSLIKPCGLDSSNVTSLKKLSGVEIDISKAKSRFIASFKKVFYEQKRREATSFPLWLTRKPLQGKIAATTKKILKELATNTVCQSARCPNIGECFANSTATFLILGNVCTRNCNFCCVNNKGFYPQPDNTEISRIISAVKKLNLKYVVITSVTRDDLKDGGSAHFAKLIITLKKELNGIKIEVLVPDFKGEPDSIRKVIEAKPYIFSHNLETVKVLYSKVRPQADYYISLNVLKIVKELDKSIITKSGIMVGLGETDNQIFELMDDLREVNCDIITIGQYLKPSKQQLDVVKFIEPNKFKYYQNVAYKKGFKYAVSAPFVRSSYNAEKCII